MRHDLLLGDQPPAGAGDRGEVEPPAELRHLGGQPGDLGEVPQVVVEHGPGRAAGQGEPGLAADVGARERGLAGAAAGGPGGVVIVVRSSGRRGSSSSRSPTLAAARVTTAGSKRSRTWSTRWAYGPKTAMNWAAGICRHWRAKNAFSRSRFGACRGANTASGQSRQTHGRAGQGLPAGPCSPDSWSAHAAVNTSRCPPTSSAITVSPSPSQATSCG